MDYTIEYNGKTNLDFGMYWDTDENFELGTGTPNIDTTDIPGVSGTILDFNGSYKSFSQKFVFYAVHKDTTANQLKTRLTNASTERQTVDPLDKSMTVSVAGVANKPTCGS